MNVFRFSHGKFKTILDFCKKLQSKKLKTKWFGMGTHSLRTLLHHMQEDGHSWNYPFKTKVIHCIHQAAFPALHYHIDLLIVHEDSSLRTFPFSTLISHTWAHWKKQTASGHIGHWTLYTFCKLAYVDMMA